MYNNMTVYSIRENIVCFSAHVPKDVFIFGVGGYILYSLQHLARVNKKIIIYK
jgi:hypothetical protein